MLYEASGSIYLDILGQRVPHIDHFLVPWYNIPAGGYKFLKDAKCNSWNSVRRAPESKFDQFPKWVNLKIRKRELANSIFIINNQ